MRSVDTDLGVAACVVNENKILLVKESRGSSEGLWGMPKGAVDQGEAPTKAVIRELKEECGIDGDVVGLIAIRERINRNIPGIFLAYSVTIQDEEIKIDPDEISDYGWFEQSDFENIDWISRAMRDIAESSLEGNILRSKDYSNERKGHYIVFS
ncbi:MAG: ADP-ribose pyrophosphatase YjhB (NUDIX family) [Candidatus Thalassarchaeaceae archaeon]|jgi:ADP-ribose pyrophosphatase YjhB (NUDIX family)